MSKIVGTHTNEVVDKNVSNPFFIKIWECKVKAHDIVELIRRKLIDLASWY
jgi:hypothetical protein